MEASKRAGLQVMNDLLGARRAIEASYHVECIVDDRLASRESIHTAQINTILTIHDNGDGRLVRPRVNAQSDGH